MSENEEMNEWGNLPSILEDCFSSSVASKVYEGLKKFESTPYASYIVSAFKDSCMQYNDSHSRRSDFYNMFMREHLVRKVRERTRRVGWDVPHIVAVLDLESKAEVKPREANYKNEVNLLIKNTLEKNPGSLTSSPKKVFHELSKKGTPREKLSSLSEHFKSHSAKEAILAGALSGLEGDLDDEFLWAKYLSMDRKVVAKVWDRNPRKDMSTEDELHCCTMPNYGPDYILDPNVSMLDFYRSGNRMVRAVLFAAKNSLRKKILVVDSIEGTDRIFSNQTDIISNFILGSIERYACEGGFDAVLYNKKCYTNLCNKAISSAENLVLSMKLKTAFKRRHVKQGYYLETIRSGNYREISEHTVYGRLRDLKLASESRKPVPLTAVDLRPERMGDVELIETRGILKMEKIRRKDLLRTIKCKKSLGVILEKGVPMGYAVGAPLNFYGRAKPDIARRVSRLVNCNISYYDSEVDDSKCFCLESIRAASGLDGIDLEQKLLEEMISRAKGKGHERFVGHTHSSEAYSNISEKVSASKINDYIKVAGCIPAKYNSTVSFYCNF